MSSSHTSRTQVPTTSHIRSSGEPISRPSSAASQSSENRGVDGWEIDPNDGTRRLDHMFSSIIGSTSHGTPGDTTVRMPPIAPQSNPVTRNPLPPQRVTNTNRNTGVFVPPANASTRRAPDQAAEDRSREERDFEVAQFNLKQSKWISQTVSAINNTLKKDLILKSDGSNFSFWTRTLKEIGRTHLTGADFFFSPSNNLSFEKIGRAIFLSCIDTTLISDVQDFKLVHLMYDHLKKKFHSISRAAQMNIWYKFMTFKIDSHTPTTGIATTLRDLYAELKTLNVRMSSDAFLGFLLQASIMSSDVGFRSDFEQRIELALQNDGDKSCPTFDSILHLFDICRQQHLLSNPPQAVISTDQTSFYTSTNSQADSFDPSVFLTGIDEAEWPDALDFYAFTAHKCWSCGGENHYARDCPLKNRSNKGVKQTERGPPIGTIVGTIYGHLPSGFAVSSGRFPNLTNRKHPSTSENQHQARRLADYYRPRYGQPVRNSGPRAIEAAQSQRASVSVQAVEIDGLPDDLDDLNFNSMSLGEDLVSQPAIFDTGASHGFTGSKSFLHDFRTLRKPIPVSVATNQGNAFITGYGSLKFLSPDGSTVVIRHILFCEHAKATLISMAALRKANCLVSYDNIDDKFIVQLSDGNILFECPFEPKKNRWCLNYPLIKPDAYDATDRSTSLLSCAVSPVRPAPSLPLSSRPICPVSHDRHLLKSPCLLQLKSTNNVESPFAEPVTSVPGYVWKPTPMTKNEEQLLHLHRVFGHASLRHIRRIVSGKLGHGLPSEVPPGNIHCPVCAISKSTKFNPLDSTFRPASRLDILSVDLIGPFQVDSIDGKKYLLTMRDVGTGFCFAKPLKSKDEANNHIISAINRLEQLTGKRLGILRSDNGGEFANKLLSQFLTGRGIRSERALPYHHYQNGVIERFNRTIAEMGRTILIDSSLPPSFWSFSFVWASHILNRLPNKCSGDITPYEAMIGQKPQYDAFRVFGSIGYAHVPQEVRKKLDPRAIRGHVVAHLGASKGWMLWDPSSNKFVSSAMVRFPTDLVQVPVTKTAAAPREQTTPNKLSLKYVMNLMKLGDFSDEVEFTDQELIVDKIIELCDFYAISVPKNFKQAMKSPEHDEWAKAIAVELSNLEQMRVWVIRHMPQDRKALDGRWVFATKPGVEKGTLRFKARFVAKGYTQVAGVDFNQTFAPTATFVSLRLLLTVAAALNWPVHSFDFVAAYLNSTIDEEVWIKPPEGMSVPAGHGLLLKKALYGTKQAARCWWLHLKGVLENLGYFPSQYDNSLYVLRHADRQGVIWLHVDDGVVTASDLSLLKQLESDLTDLLKIKWEQSLTTIVGVNVKRSTAGFQLSQVSLIDSILAAHWDGSSTATTPLPPGFNATTADISGDPLDSGKYLSIIGSLSYLAVGTRPDICFAVNYLARFAARPGPQHWKGVNHLLNYLAGSRHQLLCLFPQQDEKPLKVYADASWGGEFARSSYGVFITFLNCPILWVSRRQQSVASSTCHAEYMALGTATRQVLWVRHLLKDVLKKDYVGHMFCDNQSAVRVATDDSSNKRTRHSDRDFYITNESLFQKKTTLTWVGTKQQLADIFTKSLPPDLFCSQRALVLNSLSSIL